jgi:HK97 family phage portal protein
MDNPQLNMPIRGPHNLPSAYTLLQHMKSTAWTCSTINSAVCATYAPKLYVTTGKSQPTPKCQTAAISKKTADYLRDRLQIKTNLNIQEVTKHPLITLLDHPNPYMNSFDLWELTTLYQETVGSTFWYLELNPLDRPMRIWPLPSHMVWIYPDVNTGGFTYTFRGFRYDENEIIHFRYPDPTNPYYYGLSPLRAAYNEALISSRYAELKIARFENRAAPDVVVTPTEPIGQPERDRLEAQWNNKFRKGGAGRALVAESDVKVQLMNQQMGDIAALAEKGSNSDDICNAFHVPLSMLSTNTNLANLQAADAQHATKCIEPRLLRRDQKLNEQLIPMFDPSGRLFFQADDPRPQNPEYDWRVIEAAGKFGFMTINEIRDGEGLPPVPWGDVPCPNPSSSTNPTQSSPAQTQ